MSRILQAARAALDAGFHELFGLKSPGDSFRVKQEFGDQDPARIAKAFRRDIGRAAKGATRCDYAGEYPPDLHAIDAKARQQLRGKFTSYEHGGIADREEARANVAEAAKQLFDTLHPTGQHSYEMLWAARKQWAELGAALYGEEDARVQQLRRDPFAEVKVDASAYARHAPLMPMVKLATREGEESPRWTPELLDTPYGAAVRAREARDPGHAPPKAFDYAQEGTPPGQLMDKLEQSAERQRLKVDAPHRLAWAAQHGVTGFPWVSSTPETPEAKLEDEAVMTVAHETVMGARRWVLTTSNMEIVPIAIKLAGRYLHHVETTGRTPLPDSFDAIDRALLLAMIDWHHVCEQYAVREGEYGADEFTAELAWRQMAHVQQRVIDLLQPVSA